MTKESPLRGLRVLLTREKEQNAPLARLLRAVGAVPVFLPAIETEALEPENGSQVTRDWNRFRWIAFTSKNGARFFKAWLEMARLPLPPHIKVAVVGPGTAHACEAAGFPVDLVPEISSGAALGELLASKEEPSPALLPCAASGRQELARALQTAGWEVVPLVIYATRRASLDPEAVAELERGVDAALFASPSAVASLFERLPLRASAALKRASLVPIGATTADALRSIGLAPVAVPSSTAPKEMIRTLEAVFARK